MQFNTIKGRKIKKQGIEVGTINREILFYLIGCLEKINDKAGLVLIFSKFLHERTFSHATSTFDEKSSASFVFVFPFQKLIVRFSLKHVPSFMHDAQNFLW